MDSCKPLFAKGLTLPEGIEAFNGGGEFIGFISIEKAAKDPDSRIMRICFECGTVFLSRGLLSL